LPVAAVVIAFPLTGVNPKAFDDDDQSFDIEVIGAGSNSGNENFESRVAMHNPR